MMKSIMFLFSMMLTFLCSEALHSQTVTEGISLLKYHGWLDVRSSTAAFLQNSDMENRIRVYIPFSINFIVFPKSTVKGELLLRIVTYLEDVPTGRFGVGMVDQIGARYDKDITEFFSTSTAIGYYRVSNRFNSIDYTEWRSAFYLATKQIYEIGEEADIMFLVGGYYIPSRNRADLHLLLGISFAKMLTLGIDLSSFWMNEENQFLSPYRN